MMKRRLSYAPFIVDTYRQSHANFGSAVNLTYPCHKEPTQGEILALVLKPVADLFILKKDLAYKQFSLMV